ncbi:MAG: carboxypeptidase-like regulatory domain-containing protein [candidate division WOR-3 bacterium]
MTAGQIAPDVDVTLEPSGGGTGGIAALVLDSLTLAPLPGAGVFAFGRAGQGSARADSQGRYLISGLPAGSYHVRSELPGYYPKTHPLPVEVAEGRVTPDILFLLTNLRPLDAGISGCALDALTQVELGGVRVTATRLTGSFETTTDSRGDYLIDGLEPGAYLVEFAAPGYEPGSLNDFVVVESGSIMAFVAPALYPVTGLAERPTVGQSLSRLRVEPNLCLGKPGLNGRSGNAAQLVSRF